MLAKRKVDPNQRNKTKSGSASALPPANTARA